MGNINHRAGVTEVNLVRRKLQLKGLTEFNRPKISYEIDQSFGVDGVTLDIKGGLLHVAYDATHINLDIIECIVRKYGADISDDWWNHLKEGYYKFVDKNIMDNAKHKPISCHQAPPGSQRKNNQKINHTL
ncbi:cation transporter [Vibrio sp. 1-Bac 57]